MTPDPATLTRTPDRRASTPLRALEPAPPAPIDGRFSWEEFRRRAELYPSYLDLKKDELVVSRMTREGFRSVNFLGAEVERLAVQRLAVPMGAILRASRADTTYRPAFQAVFHTAFCGSTLLSRTLDALGAFVLKEPQILGDLCGIRRAIVPSGQGRLDRLTAPIKRAISRAIGSGAMRSLKWNRAVQAAVIELLARPFHGHEPVVVKMNDDCNELMSELTPRAGIFLYGSVVEFLTAVLKSPERRQWMNRRFGCYEPVARRLGLLPASEPSPSADHRRAATLWATYVRLYEAAASRGRLRALSCAALMANPAAAVAAVCEYFEMPASEGAIHSVVNGDLFRFHAKDRSKRFDRQDRRLLAAQLQERFKTEIADAVAWLTPFQDPARPLPNPLVLGGGART